MFFYLHLQALGNTATFIATGIEVCIETKCLTLYPTIHYHVSRVKL